MRKTSTKLLEQGTQTPSPAPDLIPAEPKNQPRTHIGIGTANGGTSQRLRARIRPPEAPSISTKLRTNTRAETRSFFIKLSSSSPEWCYFRRSQAWDIGKNFRD
jgi:hypothetical protein